MLKSSEYSTGETVTVGFNLARSWIVRCGKTVEQALCEYDDACIDFAGDFLGTVGRGRLAYFETPDNPKWRYHAAVEIDGMVHDLWTEEVMPLDEYMAHIGANKMDYTA